MGRSGLGARCTPAPVFGLLLPTPPRMPSSPDPDQRAQFDIMDTDGSGEITMEDLHDFIMTRERNHSITCAADAGLEGGMALAVRDHSGGGGTTLGAEGLKIDTAI